MISLENTTHIVTPLADLITNEEYMIIFQACAIGWTTMCLFGIVSNVINIKTFIAMGLSDGVTVSFLALAAADLAYVTVSFVLGIGMFFYVTEFKYKIIFAVEPLSLCIYLFNISVLINILNSLITTFLALARCMCVAMPLQFKNMFTRQRAVVINIMFLVFSIISYSPVLANMSMPVMFDPKLNISRPKLWVSHNRESVKIIVWMIVEVVLPVTTQIIVIVCVVVMANCLRAAAKFRQTSTGAVATTKQNDQVVTDSEPETKKKSDNATSKELRVVQQVVLISMVYIICNIPKIIISFATMLVSDFTIGKRYHKLYLSVNSLGKQFEVVNAIINLIIYYKYNTKFRALVKC